MEYCSQFYQMKRISIIFSVLIFFGGLKVKADEGMWIPSLLMQNYAEMKRMGLELTPEQLYSVNNSSLKDAIVRLGSGFCTGEIISEQSLMLTNHHCGYGAIQKLSTPANNILKNGFWAKTKKDELPAGFSVSFLQFINDVTPDILNGVSENDTEEERAKKIAENAAKLRKNLSSDKKFDVDVKSMYNGNRFYAYVYLTFKDVRLVGTPPEYVGKYGKDTDNWMWPRHTGDFSMFRVYANKDNEPADYSVDNVPYKPKHHLPVSMAGVQEADFAMIFGFPGSTDRYLSSYGVKLATDKDQPARVKLRRTKLDIYEKYQRKDDAVNLQYASKHAGVSNYWKYFDLQSKGLKKLKVYEQKQREEEQFSKWVDQGDAKRKATYSNVIQRYNDAYKIYDEKILARVYFGEAIAGIEFVSYGFSYARLKKTYESLNMKNATTEEKTKSQAAIDAILKTISEGKDGYFKNYFQPIDREVAIAMITAYLRDVVEAQRPEKFNLLMKKNKNNIEKVVDIIFKKSILVDSEKINKFLSNPSLKGISKDPGVIFSEIFLDYYMGIYQTMFKEADAKRDVADRLYQGALMEMFPDKLMYPNANSTMRASYGQVFPYSPADAVFYNYYTNMKGVLEKYVKGDYEFDLSEEFLIKAKSKNFGKYAKPGEDLRICFLSNNDITGGNSGSPVINGKGQLIGLAFDGNSEAMSGDIAFEPNLQRTINVDIRYVLWTIDILSGAGHLVDEMTLVY